MTLLPPRAFALTVAVAAASVVAVGQGARAPVRVYATATAQFVSVDAMLADIAQAGVAFIGERHDDINTHRVERSLLEGLALRRGDVMLVLEMFERDVQEPLDHFQMGHVAEAEFLGEARAWPEYATAYKPLVDFAIAKGWPVVAGNVPRSLAAEVSRSGLGVLASKPDAEKAWFARELRCPTEGPYFLRVQATLAGQPGTGHAADASYFAQCLKDETMGESIAQAYTVGAIGGKRPLVLSLTGAFHSDFRDGLVERTRRRLPGTRTVVITILPVPDIERAIPEANARERADYLVYTVRNGTP